MANDEIDFKLERTIEEFHQYLSDLIPPLVAADCVEILLMCPAEVVATTIHAWVASQLGAGRSIPVSDYFYHAVKKIHMMGEYHLVQRDILKEFLEKLKPLILEYCPPGDRAILQKSMDAMASAVPTTSASQVEVIYRQTGTAAQQSGGISEPQPSDEFSGLRLLMERIRREVAPAASSLESRTEQMQQKTISEALAQAARSSRESMQLQQVLQHLQGIGIKAGTEEVFRALGRDVPEWSLQLTPEMQLPENSNLTAMRRIVTQSEDRKESAIRFHQMVKAAGERFNEGHLAQAVAIFDLAEKIIAAKEVDESIVENMRRRGHEELDADRLRKYAETPHQHKHLRTVLNFFESLTVQGLIKSLSDETKRDRRRLLLALLECHGASTRVWALECLGAPLGANADDHEIYLRRNLLYLLRRITPEQGESQQALIQILAHHATLQHPLILLKETVACLAQIKHENAEEVLKGLLKEIESMLVNSTDATLEPNELLQLLDRVCAALARQGTSGSRRLLLEHAFKKKPKLGDTTSRLAELSSQDLSSDIPTVELLLATLEQNLPKKFLGLLMHQKDRELKPIVEALSGTPLPRVRQKLEQIAQKFPNRPSGQAARKALSSQAQQPVQSRPGGESAGSSLAGDLEFFGLCSLFQSLSDNAVTGKLTLKTLTGERFGQVEFEKGKICSSQAGKLTGETAVLQLLESPQPGTFQFVRTTEVFSQTKLGKEVLPLLLEGIRRYDELQQARAVLPDHVRLIAKGGQPTQLADEKDGLLFRELWTAVRSGATPLECENAVAADSYRIRRLLLHWVESGSLTAS